MALKTRDVIWVLMAGLLMGCAPGIRTATEKDIITSADVYTGPAGTIKRFDESRIIDGKYTEVLRAMMDALQNKGFYIGEVDFQTGFLRANTPDSLLGEKGLDKYLPPLPKLSLGLVWTTYAGVTHQVVTIAAEEIRSGKVRVRVSALRYLHVVGAQGVSMNGHYPEFDPELISSIFSELDKELVTRRIMSKS
ncbi:MAG: hypothetical protein FJ247_11690 [Nitrospira sp.]|nr:hypothetical protein [Nitrospira sp.]